jgi:hypothetical protein
MRSLCWVSVVGLTVLGCGASNTADPAEDAGPSAGGQGGQGGEGSGGAGGSGAGGEAGPGGAGGGGAGGTAVGEPGCASEGRSAEDLLVEAQTALGAVPAARASIREALYAGIERVDFDPVVGALGFRAGFQAGLVPFLVGTLDGIPSLPLGVAGEAGGRFVALGANPLPALHRHEPSAGESMGTLLRNAATWAAARQPAKVATAWLGNGFAEWSAEDAQLGLGELLPDAVIVPCEGAPEGDCLEGADLLVLGAGDIPSVSPADARAAVDAARGAGLGVLYLDNGYGDYRSIALAALGLQSAELPEGTRVAGDTAALGDVDLTGLEQALEVVRSGSLRVEDYVTCLASETLLSCGQAEVRAKLLDGLRGVRERLAELQAAKVDLCAGTAEPHLRALVAAGDAVRRELRYPVRLNEDPVATGRALFADHTVYYRRAGNPAQADLGSFVCPRDRVLAGEPCDQYRPLEASAEPGEIRRARMHQRAWTATGFYALPGVDLRVRRTDATDGAAGLIINFQLDEMSVVAGEADARITDRPQFLRSPEFSLAPDEEVVLSTPYGGPIYLWADGSAAGETVSFQVDGAARHPYLDIREPESVAGFGALLAESPLAHVDVVGAEGLEVHLRKDLFVASLEQLYRGDVAQLASDVGEGFSGAYLELAARPKPGLEVIDSLRAEVRDHCLALGWRCDDDRLHRDADIKHAFYDQNSACYTNPCALGPEAVVSFPDEPFDPLGWGFAHEFGHLQQSDLLNIRWISEADRNVWGAGVDRSAEVSVNLFSYFTFWNISHQGRRVGGDSAFASRLFANAFALRRTVAAGGERLIAGERRPAVYDAWCNAARSHDASGSGSVAEAFWNSQMLNPAGEVFDDEPFQAKLAFYISLPFQVHGRTLADGLPLSDGWNLIPLLNLAWRQFAAAAEDDARWESEREVLGFGGLPRTGPEYGEGSIAGITGNDFLLIVLSYVTGLDYRPYFAAYGVLSSDWAQGVIEAHVQAGRVTEPAPTGVPALVDRVAPVDLAEIEWLDPEGDAPFVNGYTASTCPACEGWCRFDAEGLCGEGPGLDGECLARCANGFSPTRWPAGWSDPGEGERATFDSASACLAELEPDATCEALAACRSE